MISSIWFIYYMIYDEYNKYDVNICLIKKGLMLKLGQLIKYYMREVFSEKYAESVYQKLVLDLAFGI